MTIDVTAYINNFIKNNPQASANVKAGASAATALFSTLDSNNLDASNLLSSAQVPNINGVSLPSATNLPSAATQTKKNLNVGIENASKDAFTKGASRSLLDEADAPIGAALPKVNDDIPILLESEVKALMVQIGYMTSNWDYQKTNYSTNQYGRYQVHPTTLRNYGYMFSGNTDFTGKDGIYYNTEFLFDSNVQDRIMEKFIKDQYRALIKAGAIRNFDSKETVAGMIAVAYQFQDAKPTLSSVSGLMSSVNPSSILSGSQDLAESLSSTLSSSQTSLGQSTSVLSSAQAIDNTGVAFANQVNASSLPATLQSLSPTLTQAAAAGDPQAAKAAVQSSNLKDSLASLGATSRETLSSEKDKISSLSNDLKAKLDPGLTALKDQSKLAAAKVDVKKLQEGADDLASSIPANKAKAWRENGTEKDSTGAPGSYFFNAGKYAIKTLAADVPSAGA